MFANCQMGGQNMGTPDVCLTPVPSPAGPVPTPMPYPNTVMIPQVLPPSASLNVLISGAPGHNMNSQSPMSNGDNAGVLGGVASSMVMGPCRHTMGSTNVLYGGSPATKMTSMTGQNGASMNVPGATLAPAQTKVMLMR